MKCSQMTHKVFFQVISVLREYNWESLNSSSTLIVTSIRWSGRASLKSKWMATSSSVSKDNHKRSLQKLTFQTQEPVSDISFLKMLVVSTHCRSCAAVFAVVDVITAISKQVPQIVRAAIERASKDTATQRVPCNKRWEGLPDAIFILP